MTKEQPTGTVIFVDRTRWTGFDQTAAALRRSGLRVVRITQEATSVAHAIDRLVYHESIGFSTTDELHAALLRFDGPDLLDVSTIDDLCLDVAATPFTAAPQAVVQRLQDRASWIDKLTASRRLKAAGVPVPDVLPATAADPARAVERLGLPLVVKNKVGAGGKGVRVVHAIDEIEPALAEVAPDLAEGYYEEFAPGETVCYSAAFDGDRIFDEAGYESHRDPANPLGPSSSLVLLEDPALLEVGRAATRALGSSGLVNYDLVRRGDEYLVIDVNFRVWNAAIMLRGAGCRFDLGYLAALTDADDGSAARVGRAGTTVDVFPDAVLYEIATTGRLDARRLQRLARPYLGWAGPRYVAAAALYALRLWSADAGLDRDRLVAAARRVTGRPAATTRVEPLDRPEPRADDPTLAPAAGPRE